MRAALLLLFALSACAGGSGSKPVASPKPPGPAPAPAAPVAAPPCPRAGALEPQAIEAELGCLLSRYVQLDTTNPPGNETMLSAGDKENVIGPNASAVLDIRLLPGEDPGAVIDEIVRVLDAPSIGITTLLSWQAQASPRDTPLFRAIEALMAERHPGVPVTANVIGGFTDCNAFRQAGFTCYGFLPARIRRSEVATVHGQDEHIALRSLTRGVMDLARLIALLAR